MLDGNQWEINYKFIQLKGFIFITNDKTYEINKFLQDNKMKITEIYDLSIYPKGTIFYGSEYQLKYKHCIYNEFLITVNKKNTHSRN